MSKNKNSNTITQKKPSKRERRMKVAVYIMVGAMLLSTLTAGLSFLF